MQGYLGSKAGGGSSKREAALEAAATVTLGGRRGPCTGLSGTVLITFADNPHRVRRRQPCTCFCPCTTWAFREWPGMELSLVPTDIPRTQAVCWRRSSLSCLASPGKLLASPSPSKAMHLRGDAGMFIRVHLESTLDFDNRQVGVRFDSALPGGINLGGACPEGHGFFCNSAQLAAESSAAERGPDAESAAVGALFDFVLATAKAGPLVVFFKVLPLANLAYLLHTAQPGPSCNFVVP